MYVSSPTPNSNLQLNTQYEIEPKSTSLSKSDCVVVGGIALDTTCTIPVSGSNVIPTSYPGNIEKTLGGVAYNVSKASTLNGKRHNVSTRLISAVGSTDSEEIFREIDLEFESQFDGKVSFDKSGLMVSDKHSSARYVSIHDSTGDLVVACADMAVIEDMDSKKISDLIKTTRPSCVVFDGNIGLKQQQETISAARDSNSIIGFEPTSVAKAERIAESSFNDPRRLLKGVIPNNSIDFATPNIFELTGLHNKLFENEYFDTDSWFVVIDSLGIGSTFRSRMEQFARKVPDIADLLLVEGITQKAIQILPYIPILLVKLGSKGVILFEIISGNASIESQVQQSRNLSSEHAAQGIVEEYFLSPNSGNVGLLIQYFPATSIHSDTIQSVTGAGDTFCGVVLSETARNPSWFYDAKERIDVIGRAQKAASLTVQSNKSVSEKILYLQ